MSCVLVGNEDEEPKLDMIEEAEQIEQPEEAVMLDRASILGLDDIVREPVYVEEWGGTVWVRVMSGKNRDYFEVSIKMPEKGKTSLEDFRAKIVVLSACDKDGNYLFGLDDIPILSEKNANALTTIAEVATRINKIGTKEQEELIENFGLAPNGDSGSC